MFRFQVIETSNIEAIAIILFLSVPLVAQLPSREPAGDFASPHRSAMLLLPLDGWNQYWDKASFITFDEYGGTPSKPEVVVYDTTGHIAREGIIWFKEARSVSSGDVAVSSKGELFVAGGTEDESGAIWNFIASVGADGYINRFVRTTPFLPSFICATGDGTVWSYGIDVDDRRDGIETSRRLRHYSFEEGQIGAMLDGASLSSPGWKLQHGRYPGDLSMRCNSKKVVLLNNASGEFVEYNLETNGLKVTKVESLGPMEWLRITGFALTESGEVFVSLHERNASHPRSGIFKLTIDASGFGSWVPVKNTIGPYLHGGPVERLLGADGDDLVYTHDQSGEAFWSKVK